MKRAFGSAMSLEVLGGYLINLHFNKDIIEETLACFSEKRYQKNDFFSLAGHSDGKLGFVIQGLFYMFIETEEGAVFTKDFLGEGKFLLAMFDPKQESLANIRAIKDSIILEANYHDIQQLFIRYPQFEHAAKQGAEKRIQALYARMESFALMEAKERYKYFREEFSDIEADIPQHLIASYLGITPTQLSRIRKK